MVRPWKGMGLRTTIYRAEDTSESVLEAGHRHDKHTVFPPVGVVPDRNQNHQKRGLLHPLRVNLACKCLERLRSVFNEFVSNLSCKILFLQNKANLLIVQT